MMIIFYCFTVAFVAAYTDRKCRFEALAFDPGPMRTKYEVAYPMLLERKNGVSGP